MATTLITKPMLEAGATVLQRWLYEAGREWTVTELVAEIYRAMDSAGAASVSPRAYVIPENDA